MQIRRQERLPTSNKLFDSGTCSVNFEHVTRNINADPSGKKEREEPQAHSADLVQVTDPKGNGHPGIDEISSRPAGHLYSWRRAQESRPEGPFPLPPNPLKEATRTRKPSLQAQQQGSTVMVHQTKVQASAWQESLSQSPRGREPPCEVPISPPQLGQNVQMVRGNPSNHDMTPEPENPTDFYHTSSSTGKVLNKVESFARRTTATWLLLTPPQEVERFCGSNGRSTLSQGVKVQRSNQAAAKAKDPMVISQPKALVSFD